MTLMRTLLLILLASVMPSAATARTLEVRADCADTRRCFSSIGAALAIADADRSGEWITVRVASGDYREKPTIARDRVRLVGSGATRTRLHFDAVAETSKRYHRDGWGTPGSATLTINAKHVTVSGIRIENDYDYPANDRLPSGDPAKIGNPQAVALLLDVGSDSVSITKSELIGYQDTLFANGRRAHITKSLIAGNVDFIFGNGSLLIEHSEIRTRRRFTPEPETPFESFVAAPSTLLDQSIGIIFYRSRLTREAGVSDASVALARPWHPTTRFPDGRYANPRAVGQVSFLDCFMDAHIAQHHWATMNGTARDGTMTDVFRPQDARFFEIGSYGPGARTKSMGMPTAGLKDVVAIKRTFFDHW